jgi:hypothetical protein
MSTQQLTDPRATFQIETAGAVAPQPSPIPLALGVAFLGTMLVAFLQGAKVFYFDSGNYWTLGDSFVKHGDFSLLNFDSPLRGYLLPLVDHGLQGLADAFGWTSSTSAKLFNVFTFSVLGALLAPRLAELCWPERRWNVQRRLGLTALLIVFWSGYLNFPLSDFPALALVLLALVAVARSDRPGWMLVAGFAGGGAIDIRPSYVMLAPVLLLLVAWASFERRGRRDSPSLARQAICLGLLVVGFVIVSAPQSLISHRNFNIWSFVPGTAAHLESLQLTEGLRLQRVGGYVGAGHPPLMIYEDQDGSKLLGEQKHHTVTGFGQYLGLVTNHPVAMGGLFARHVLNGLDQRYSTPYIEHLDSDSHRWMRLAGFLLVFLALLRLIWPAARRSLGVGRWRYPLALLICCLTAVPSAMEPRYMLPVYLLSYMLVLAPGWPSPFKSEGNGVRRFRTLGTIAVAFVLFMVVVGHAVSGASSHLHFAY